MLIPRFIYPRLLEAIQPGKVVILYGPRRVGKTTILKKLVQDTHFVAGVFTGDSTADRRNLSIEDISHIRSIVGQSTLVVVDEAQKIDHIGTVLKILVDYMPHIAVIVSGSASLDLAQRAEGELVGRNKNFTLYPFGFAELASKYGKIIVKDNLERWLVWGGYPEVVIQENAAGRAQYLQSLIGTYLYRDILELSGIKKPKIVEDILRLLAFQIGQEVSVSELAQQVSLNKDTVAHYLDLLEKSFVIMNIRGFSRNLRKEISKNSRYYFWDNGVRNALINNFNPLNVRNDVGQLWENYLAIERMKKLSFEGTAANLYFWRTYDQKEIDWIEESGGHIAGYEFRWSNTGKIKASVQKDFLAAYPGARLSTVTQDSFEQFIG